MTQSPAPFAIPHRAKGFDVGDLSIEFRTDNGKIVLTRNPSHGEHYTIELGGDSGVLDFHRTWREAGEEHHQTLFALLREDLPILLGELGPVTFRLLSLRRLRLGWLARHGIDIVTGLDPVTIEEIAAVTARARRRRLILDEAKYRAQIRTLEYLEEIWDLPDGQFSLVQRGRRIGIGFKVTDRLGQPRLYWMNFRGLIRRANVVWDEIVRTASRFAIPKEKYYKYPFLCP